MSNYKELLDTGVMTRGNSWDEYIATFTSERQRVLLMGAGFLASVETAKEQAGEIGV